MGREKRERKWDLGSAREEGQAVPPGSAEPGGLRGGALRPGREPADGAGIPRRHAPKRSGGTPPPLPAARRRPSGTERSTSRYPSRECQRLRPLRLRRQVDLLAAALAALEDDPLALGVDAEET